MVRGRARRRRSLKVSSQSELTGAVDGSSTRTPYTPYSCGRQDEREPNKNCD